MENRILTDEEKLALMTKLAEMMTGFIVCNIEGVSRKELIHLVIGAVYATLYNCTCESRSDLDCLLMALSSEVVSGYVALR